VRVHSVCRYVRFVRPAGQACHRQRHTLQRHRRAGVLQVADTERARCVLCEGKAGVVCVLCVCVCGVMHSPPPPFQVREHGLQTMLRQTMGDDVSGACGQLVIDVKKKVSGGGEGIV
jgi:hypothetical protein